MTHLVIPRKYRPQTFEELVGQESIKSCFLSLISRQVIPSAVLLSGTRGVGKTSTARIFSKALLCQDKQDSGNPCGVCDRCKQVERGNHIDVLEIDGASNNGVEAVRELRETAKYLPVEGAYKVYIIDEVHMLSNNAFNALLKVLEEPPAHLVFVFATTEPRALPATILSRVMQFTFQPIRTDTLATHLAYISKHENRPITKPALSQIALMGDGSLRDAEMLLEQVFAFFDPSHEITLTDLQQLFSLVSQTEICTLINHIGQSDTNEVVSLYHRLLNDGYDPYTLGLEVQKGMRYVMLARLSPKWLEKELDYIPEFLAKVTQVAKLPAFTHESLLMMFPCILKTLQTMRYADHPEWVLEACLVQLAHMHIWTRPTTQPSQSKPTAHQAKAPPQQLTPRPQQATPPPRPTHPPQQQSTSTVQGFLEIISSRDPILYGLLKSCQITLTDKHIRILKGANQFTFEQLKDKRNQEKILMCCQGTPYAKKILLFSDASPSEVATPKASLAPNLDDRRNHMLNHPLVKNIQKTLGGEIVKVIEDQGVVESDPGEIV